MRLNFVLSEVAAGLRRNLTMTVAMILTTAISLGLMGTGLLIASMISEMKQMSKGRGVIVMGLEKDEKLVGVVVSDQPRLIVAGVARGRQKEITIAEKDMGHYVGHRARMGRVLPDKLKPTALKTVPKPKPETM